MAGFSPARLATVRLQCAVLDGDVDAVKTAVADPEPAYDPMPWTWPWPPWCSREERDRLPDLDKDEDVELAVQERQRQKAHLECVETLLNAERHADYMHLSDVTELFAEAVLHRDWVLVDIIRSSRCMTTHQELLQQLAWAADEEACRQERLRQPYMES